MLIIYSKEENKFIDISRIKRVCLNCNKLIELVIKRDIKRKHFCSHACRQIWRYNNGEFTWLEKMQKLASTPEANKLKAHKGRNHPLYKFDRSQIKSPRPRFELTKWRNKVFERDSYTCVICKQRGGRLNADHIKSYAAFPTFRFDVSNGRTLCESCHKQTETYGRSVKYHSLQVESAATVSGK